MLLIIIDVDENKLKGEMMDLQQGQAFMRSNPNDDPRTNNACGGLNICNSLILQKTFQHIVEIYYG